VPPPCGPLSAHAHGKCTMHDRGRMAIVKSKIEESLDFSTSTVQYTVDQGGDRENGPLQCPARKLDQHCGRSCMDLTNAERNGTVVGCGPATKGRNAWQSGMASSNGVVLPRANSGLRDKTPQASQIPSPDWLACLHGAWVACPLLCQQQIRSL
jgi:hypothetical protein